MGWNFRKSIKIAPGIKLNFGKKSKSISIGGKYGGVTINSKGDVTTRSSIPGTGISRTTKLSSKNNSSRQTSHSASNKKSSSAKQMYLTMAENDMRIIKESSVLVEQTTNPGVFFSRMDILFERYEHLASIEQHIPMSGLKPSDALQKLKLGYDDNVQEFIEHYFSDTNVKAKTLKTKSGKENRISKAFDTLMEYKDKMCERNITLAEHLRDKYLQECG